jgi:MYXO-CTERM domain-containing protein
MGHKFFGAAWVAACALAAAPAGAITLGQSDTFEDGSLQGWGNGPGNAAPPQNIASGGPAGSGDAYLLTTSSGVAGPGGRLVLISGPAWGGNYPLAGVTGLAVDLYNMGSTELVLRLLVEGPVGASAYSTVPVVLNPGSGWTHVTFSTLPAAFTGQAVPALAAATQLRLFHSTSGFPGDAIAAVLAVDNVSAVPEAGSAGLLLVGLAALGLRRVRHGPCLGRIRA